MSTMLIPGRAWRNRTTICWVVAAAAVAIAVVRIAFFMPIPPNWIDSYAFIQAGQQLLHNPAPIYGQAEVQAATGQPTMAFLYPPSALALFIPFARLGDSAGIGASAIAWLAVEVGALVWSLFLWIRVTGLRPTVAAPLALVLAVSAATVSDINSGQINGVAILLATLGVTTFPSLRSGLWLGLAIAIKPALLPLLLVPLFVRKGSVLALAVVVGVSAQLCLVPLMGASAVVSYFTTVLPAIGRVVVQDANNISPANLLATWVGGRHPYRHSQFGISPWQFPQVAAVLTGAIRFALLAMSAKLAWNKRDMVAVFAFVLATIPLLAGTTWLHYLVFAYPLTVVVLSRLRRRVGLVLGGLALLTLDPFLNLIFVPDWGQPPDLLAIATLVHIEIITLALLVGLLIAFWKLALSGGHGQRLAILGGDVVSCDLPGNSSEEHASDDVHHVVLA